MRDSLQTLPAEQSQRGVPSRIEVARGATYNRLTVIREVAPLGGNRRFLCECKCGRECEVTLGNLRKAKSCGCYRREVAAAAIKAVSGRRREVQAGDQHGHWTIIREVPSRGNVRYVFCRCECGTEREMRLQWLIRPGRRRSTSCGCYRQEAGQVSGRLAGSRKRDRRRTPCWASLGTPIPDAQELYAEFADSLDSVNRAGESGPNRTVFALEIPPKLCDVLDRQFLPAQNFQKQAVWRYQHAVRQLSEALAYRPSIADLTPYVIGWLAHRLQLHGYSPETIRDVLGRLRTLAAWCRLNRPD